MNTIIVKIYDAEMKKKDLPEKICPVCQLPFKWRKKWEKNWEAVKYCSERCRRNRSKKLGKLYP